MYVPGQRRSLTKDLYSCSWVQLLLRGCKDLIHHCASSILYGSKLMKTSIKLEKCRGDSGQQASPVRETSREF